MKTMRFRDGLLIAGLAMVFSGLFGMSSNAIAACSGCAMGCTINALGSCTGGCYTTGSGCDTCTGCIKVDENGAKVCKCS